MTYSDSVVRLSDAADSAGLDMRLHAPAFAHLRSVAERLDDGAPEVALAREFRQSYQQVVSAVAELRSPESLHSSTLSSLWGLAESALAESGAAL